jgi:hypothetical protein
MQERGRGHTYSPLIRAKSTSEIINVHCPNAGSLLSSRGATDGGLLRLTDMRERGRGGTLTLPCIRAKSTSQIINVHCPNAGSLLAAEELLLVPRESETHRYAGEREGAHLLSLVYAQNQHHR